MAPSASGGGCERLVDDAHPACPEQSDDLTWPQTQTCSGDIYAAVPMITPIRVAAAVRVGD